MGKFFFWMPCWMFLSVLALLFLVALSCTPETPTPTPTYTPEVEEYRKCLVQETRLDRRPESLDAAVKKCGGG